MIKIFLLSLLSAIPILAQGSGVPNCQFSYELTNRTTEKPDGVTVIQVSAGVARTPSISNRIQNCNSWYMTTAVDGFSAISLELDDAQNVYSVTGGAPGSWSAFQGTVNSGTNPTTSTGSSSLNITGFYPWMSVSLGSSTGTGSIYVTLYGWKSPALLASGGGGSGTITNIATAGGLTGGPITSSGTISTNLSTNQQASGYTLLASDFGKILVATANTATFNLPQAGTTGFETGKSYYIMNNFGSGAFTINTTTSTFTGAGSSGSSLSIPSNTSVELFSVGGNWGVLSFGSGGGSSLNVEVAGSGSSAPTTLNFTQSNCILQSQSGSGTVSLQTSVDTSSCPNNAIVQSNSLIFGTGGGTANTQTAAYTPTIGALTNGMVLCWTPTNTNTANNPTFSPDSLTAHTITTAGGFPIALGALNTSYTACATYSLGTTSWILNNPYATGGTLVTGTGQVIAASTVTPLILSTVVKDDLTSYNAGSNTLLTIPRTGWYTIQGVVNRQGGGSASIGQSQLYKNGSVIPTGTALEYAASTYFMANSYATIPCVAGDTIQLEFVQYGGGSETLQSISLMIKYIN